MNSERCSYVFIYLSVLYTMVAMAAADTDIQNQPLKCWSVGKTSLKICIDENDVLPSIDIPHDIQMSKKHVDSIFPPEITYTPYAMYNRFVPTDFGRAKMPFFMKRRWYRHSDVIPGRGLPYKMADNDRDLSLVNKRPFDSISYNAGLGGFK